MSLRRGVTVLCVALMAMVGTVAPVAAHSETDEFVPSPGQEVGGTVDRIEIRFLAPVTAGVVLLEAPDGTRIDGESSLPDDTTLRFEMEPLDQAGQHIVTWRVRSFDGDGQEEAFAFTWDPAAPPLDDHDGGPPLWGIALIVALAVLVVGLAVRLVLRLRATPAAG